MAQVCPSEAPAGPPPEAPPTPGKRPRKSPGAPVKHGLYALGAALRRPSALDRRSTVSRQLEAFKADVAADLGGEDTLSRQQRTLLAAASRTWLLLESVDAWLLAQERLVDKRRQLIPALQQRATLATTLERQLAALGLERKAREVSWEERVAALRASRQEG